MNTNIFHLVTIFTALALFSPHGWTQQSNQNQGQQQQGQGGQQQGNALSKYAPGAGLQGSGINQQQFLQNLSGATQTAQEAAQNRQQQEAMQRSQADSVVRQERQQEVKRGKNIINTSSPTGGKTAYGRERDLENLTDAEKVLSEEFVHDGMINRMIKEECQGDMAIVCRGEDPSQRGIMLQAASRAYSMIVGAMGGKLERREGGGGEGNQGQNGGNNSNNSGGNENSGSQGENGNQANNGDGEKKEMQDYCRFVAMGTEALAMFQQQMAQSGINKLPTNTETKQKDMLLRAAISHEERAKQAKFQTIGWGATAGCYWTMLAFAQPSLGLGLKIAGSSLLTFFFHKEIERQKGFAKAIRGIADRLPGKGDCNPVTDRLCYCAQPETMHDPDFCMDQIRDRHLANNVYANVACIDSRAQADPQCRCLDTDSCFDRKIENDLRGIGFGNLELKGIRPIQELSRGSLSNGALAGMDRQVSALSDRFERSPEIRKMLEDRGNHPKQKELAQGLNAQGIKPTLSRMMSVAPANAATPESLEKFSAWGGPEDLANYLSNSGVAKSNDRTLQFRGGYGLQGYGNTQQNDAVPNPFDKFKQNEERAPANNVLEFAERAQQSAQITRNRDTPLFEIISHRYRLSAWTRLPMDIDDEVEP